MRKYFIKSIVCFLFLNSFFMLAQDHKNVPTKKIIIAHRGASGYLPEHTTESKSMAYAMNPDFIEQDIVLSKDNVPIVIHDIYLEATTNVEKVFPKRSRQDGRFYVIDFTFEELLTLDVFERVNPKSKKVIFPNRFPYGKSSFKLHSLRDEIELIQGLNKSTGKNIGIAPEIKNPQFHQKNGKDISKIVLGVLKEYGYQDKTTSCMLQCFDKNELKRIRLDLNSNLYLVQLISIPGQENNILEYSKYADAIGIWTKLLIKGYDENGDILISEIVNDLHKMKMKVFGFTFREDQLSSFSSFDELLNMGFNKANLDGIFTDFPDKAIQFINQPKL